MHSHVIRYATATIVAFTCVFAQVGHAADTLIHAGRVITAEGDEILEKVTIIVREGKIAAIQDGFIVVNQGDTVFDLREYTVMPGLMDMHTHLITQHHEKVYSDKFFMSEADFALRSVHYARLTLLAGFTTVRDVGDNGGNSVALRRAIEAGWIVGPRIFTSGKSLATTGGHADPTNGLQGDFKRDAGPVEGVINGPDEARKGVRQRYKDGADLIKLTATGGVLSLAASGDNPQFTMEELRAIVETARDYNMTVAVHAHGAEGMKRAVLAGVDSIEHGTYMTEEIMALMKERGTYLVPTILAGVWVAEKAKEEGYFPSVVRPKAAAIGPVIQETFAKAYAYGVNIAFGTDSGVSPHGENAREFELMVAGGMDPLEAIRAATYHGAKLLRVEDRLGTVTAGKIADLVAVKGNPLDDVSLMRDVRFVMKEGVVYKHDPK
ncbi:MAG: amidohydrolase family protein [Planctomycetota bacterium]|nr:MAG: amidohydrolase family protein [Planctomycetota bacterium]